MSLLKYLLLSAVSIIYITLLQQQLRHSSLAFHQSVLQWHFLNLPAHLADLSSKACLMAQMFMTIMHIIRVKSLQLLMLPVLEEIIALSVRSSHIRIQELELCVTNLHQRLTYLHALCYNMFIKLLQRGFDYGKIHPPARQFYYR